MGNLYVIATPIGNLNDFSKRAIDTLNSCDLILVEDTRQTIKLLNAFDIKKKMISYHKFNEAKRSEEILQNLKNGSNIALVSDAGTPCISDPGYILVNMARQNNIKVIGIPGCSASITALSISGLDTSSFSFYGFVPVENKQRKELFELLKTSDIKTKVLYESPKRIIKLLEDLKKEIPGCVVCVCKELTKIHEISLYGSIEEVYEIIKQDINHEKGEYVVVVNNETQNIVKAKESIESLIVNEMINDHISLKDAVNKVNIENKNISKKDIYSASLNLKELFK